MKLTLQTCDNIQGNTAKLGFLLLYDKVVSELIILPSYVRKKN